MREIRDAEHERHQGDNDDRESAARSRHYRRAKRLNAVADGLDARHRGASAGECAQQNPRAYGFGGLGEMRRRNDRMRMPARGNRCKHPPDHHREEAQYKDAGRQHKHCAGLLDAAQIHEGRGDVVRFAVAGDGELIGNLGTVTGSRQLELANGRAGIRLRLTGKRAVASVSAAGVASGFCTI